MNLLEECPANQTATQHRQLIRQLNSSLKKEKIGITAQQLFFLYDASLRPGMIAAEYCREQTLHKSSLSRNLSRIEDMGLVFLKGEGKTKQIHMTEKGKFVINKALPVWKKFIEQNREG